MWPPAALEFLRDLEDNNDRDWFKANRARYDSDLRAPGQALADALGDFGTARFFRPYNDARFHHRPPIKEQLGIAIGYGGAGGYYVELSLDGLLVGAGPAPSVHRSARAIPRRDRRRPPRRRLRARAEDRRGGGPALVEPELKRAPRGYPRRPPAHRAAAPEEPDRLRASRARAVAARGALPRDRARRARGRPPARHVAGQARRAAACRLRPATRPLPLGRYADGHGGAQVDHDLACRRRVRRVRPDAAARRARRRVHRQRVAADGLRAVHRAGRQRGLDPRGRRQRARRPAQRPARRAALALRPSEAAAPRRRRRRSSCPTGASRPTSTASARARRRASATSRKRSSCSTPRARSSAAPSRWPPAVGWSRASRAMSTPCRRTPT